MHVLLIGSSPRVFSTGNFEWLSYTARALRRLGHAVTVFPWRESWAASPSLVGGLGWIPGVTGSLGRYQQARVRWRDRAVIKLTEELRPDLVLVLKGEHVSGEVLSEVKRRARGPLVTWWVDDPWRFPWHIERFAIFDHVFIFDRAYLSRVMDAGAQQAHFLPCACDETVYRPMRVRPPERRRFACDVAFVAWGYPEREAMVRALADAVDVGVWGRGWEALKDVRTPSGVPVIRGPAVSSRMSAMIYNVATIGLNIHAAQTRLAGVNTRTFELLASGLFELVDQIPGLEELLEPEVEVVCYRSPEEARRLLRYYLRDAGARAAVARRGRARVLDEHTYVCRMRTLCDISQRSTRRDVVPVHS